jgi:hypothetical protein
MSYVLMFTSSLVKKITDALHCVVGNLGVCQTKWVSDIPIKTIQLRNYSNKINPPFEGG